MVEKLSTKKFALIFWSLLLRGFVGFCAMRFQAGGGNPGQAMTSWVGPVLGQKAKNLHTIRTQPT